MDSGFRLALVRLAAVFAIGLPLMAALMFRPGQFASVYEPSLWDWAGFVFMAWMVGAVVLGVLSMLKLIPRWLWD